MVEEGSVQARVDLVPETRMFPGRVLVAIPCFNEALAIASVVLRARRHADEVLVVDDGSSDGTAEIAAMAGARVVRHAKNQGKGAAVQTAFRYAKEARFDAMVLMDGDGQHDPDEIPSLLEPVLGRNGSSVDVALGFRFGENTEMPRWRRVGKRVLDYATALGSGKTEAVDSQCGYRAYGKRAIAEYAGRLAGQGFATESEQLMVAQDIGLRLENVPVHCRYEGLDGSTQGPVRHAIGVLGSLVDFVTMKHPLATMATPGVLFLAGSVLLGTHVVRVLNQSGQLATGWAISTAMLAILGTMGIFAGLMMRVITYVVPKAR